MSKVLIRSAVLLDTIMRGRVTDCYSTGAVEQEVLSIRDVPRPTGASAGGLIGRNDAYVGRCYATGDVSGRTWVGGLVGENHGTVEQCCSTGSATGASYTGGLVGINREGEISKCYSIGAVTEIMMWVDW